MRAIFIRHGESTGNAGIPCHDLATIELTERGQEQAHHVAASWTEAPALIVTSPYTGAFAGGGGILRQARPDRGQFR